MRETGTENFKPYRHFIAITTMIVALVATLALVAPGEAGATPRGGLTMPTPSVKPSTARIVSLARVELRRRPAERRSNNVPRYRNGRGRVAPYSIGAAWCVAFSTWVWRRAGFTAYMTSDLLRRSFDRSVVAVQVKALTSWAIKNNYWSYRAKPGYLVLYGTQHIGIVERIDRDGRAVTSIEGNKSDRVSRVTIDMSRVTGYISPTAISLGQFVPEASSLADVD
jgi:hypothetical protein